MAFYKKILLLKEQAKNFTATNKSLSGIARIESDEGSNKFYLSLVNLKSAEKGEFVALILDGENELFSFNLGNNQISSCFDFPYPPNFKRGFCVGVFHSFNGKSALIAYASTQDFAFSKEQFLKKSEDADFFNKKAVQNDDEKSQEEQSHQKKEYDDEAVATENYYIFEQEKEQTDYAKQLLLNQTDDATLNLSQEEGSTKETADASFDEILFKSCQKDVVLYYEKVKDDLDNLFKNHPPENSLNSAVPYSKWVRINYSPDKHYAVGIIFQNKQPKYICYGVPAKYSANPPEKLKGYCSFLPLSLFDLNGDGYWMMYQDASTGECVKINFYD